VSSGEQIRDDAIAAQKLGSMPNEYGKSPRRRPTTILENMISDLQHCGELGEFLEPSRKKRRRRRRTKILTSNQ
jgi:hypothetical protein